MEPAETADDIEGDIAPQAKQRRSRRLSDKILLVFHAACDVREFQVARQLLTTLEWMMSSSSVHSATDRRRNTEALVAAHERLWSLEHEATGV